MYQRNKATSWIRICPECDKFFKSYAKSNHAKCEDCKIKIRKLAQEKMKKVYKKRRKERLTESLI